jgi:hypothetical protein
VLRLALKGRKKNVLTSAGFATLAAVLTTLLPVGLVLTAQGRSLLPVVINEVVLKNSAANCF